MYLLFFLVGLASCHTVFTTLYVNGNNQGDGVCVRMNHHANNASFPIEPLSSPDVACGYNGESAVSRVCPASASSTLTFEFREYPDASQPGSIDPSHKGPCAVYMKKVANATEDNNAAGPGWFKIWEYTYADGKWCTEKLIENNGHISVTIPDDIQAGYYLVRPELLALHAAQDDPPDPQFYVGCAQIFIKDGGNAKPETVEIGQGTYDLSMPGLTYNIYETPLKLPYPMPGPDVYTPGQKEKSKRSAMVQTDGLKPDGCILVRDNWCGFEVPSYTDQEGCWKASQNCWSQGDDCWASVPPTGGSNCKIWEEKCHDIDDHCNNQVFPGPPHKGKDLTPKPTPLKSKASFKRHKRVH